MQNCDIKKVPVTPWFRGILDFSYYKQWDKLIENGMEGLKKFRKGDKIKRFKTFKDHNGKMEDELALIINKVFIN